MKKVMTKIVSVVLTVVMILGAAPLSGLVGLELPDLFSFESKALTSGDFTYTVSGSNATITGYSGSAANLTIPSRLGGYKVTKIDDGSFKSNNNLVTVIIPSSITTIEGYYSNDGAFQYCSKLKSVTFEKGTSDASIGPFAFADCPSLESVYIPRNYVSVGAGAFKGDLSITSFEWEKSSSNYANQTIGSEAFKNCSNLSDICLPTTLKSIGEGAFANCSSLKNVVIPEGVTFIDESAFISCKKLTTLSLPSTLTKIEGYYSNTGAFEYCSSLKTVTFAEGEDDASIGPFAFADCSSLESVYIPGNYVSVGAGAFKGASNMSSFEWEKSSSNYANQTIGSEAFKNCTNLSLLSLPTTLNNIAEGTFANCSSLKNVVIPEGVTFIDESAFINCTKLTTLSLPSTLTKIEGYYSNTGAFQNCSALKTVIFAEGDDDVTIGKYSFANCAALTTVHIPLNVVSIDGTAFNSSTSNLTLCSRSSSSYGKTFADSKGIKFKVCTSHEEIKPDMPKYTVTYNANGGSVSPTSSLVEKDSSTTLPTPTKSYTVSFNANGGSNAPASLKASLTCKGWSTSASATSATYFCGAAFAPTNNTTLYAVWNTSASFNVPASEPTRDGYEFLGWAASNSSTTASIHAGDRVNVSGNATYYAVWKEIPSLTVSQTELTLDLDNVDTGFATVAVNRPSNEALTLEASSSSTSVAMVELGDYDSTDDTCPATFIVKGVGTCTVTFKLYSADKSVLYDTETVTINVKQDATKQIGMNYNGVTVIDDFDGVYFESLNPDVATVDDNGKITATGRGDAIILVTDADGNISYYNITVTFSIFQWIIYILFFGWLWY